MRLRGAMSSFCNGRIFAEEWREAVRGGSGGLEAGSLPFSRTLLAGEAAGGGGGGRETILEGGGTYFGGSDRKKDRIDD